MKEDGIEYERDGGKLKGKTIVLLRMRSRSFLNSTVGTVTPESRSQLYKQPLHYLPPPPATHLMLVP